MADQCDGGSKVQRLNGLDKAFDFCSNRSYPVYFSFPHSHNLF